jgi:hypothetical protein
MRKRFNVKEFLYEGGNKNIYDPITDWIYGDSNDANYMLASSFYYFNMQKDQEEYLRDLQLK